jgi:hypothetical protein
MNIKTYNTLPSKKDSFWQVIIIPSLVILKSVDVHDKYIAINAEWLFWAVTLIIKINDQKSISYNKKQSFFTSFI